MKRGSGPVCTALAMFLAVATGGAQESLLTDGGFETLPTRWQLRNGAQITDVGARSGQRCLRLQGSGQVDAFCAAPCLQAGQFYRVDAWVRVRGVPAGREGYAIVYIDGAGSTRANLDDHDWEPITLWFPARDDKPFRIYLILAGLPEGEVLFDDVALRPCTDPNLAPVTFDDGTILGLQFYGPPGTIGRVVKHQTPRGGEYCLLAAPGSFSYRLPREITAGTVEFGFTINLQGSASFSLGGLRLDFVPLIMNNEDRDGAPLRQSLGAFAPGRWYRFRGVVNLDTQRYDLAVTDYEDPLSSFTRKQLRFAAKTEKVTNFWLSAPRAGGLFDDIYLGRVLPGT